MEVTRKQLLAGGAALALAGCGGRKKARRPSPRRASTPRYRHFDAFLFAAHGSRCATRSSATGAGWTPARRRTCTSTRPSSTRRWPRPRRRTSASSAASSRSPTRPRWASGSSTPGLLEPGDEVLTTEHDHYATHEALRLAGAEVRQVALYDDPAQATAERDAQPRCAPRSRRARRSSR